jgi:hypothetical protein
MAQFTAASKEIFQVFPTRAMQNASLCCPNDGPYKVKVGSLDANDVASKHHKWRNYQKLEELQTKYRPT